MDYIHFKLDKDKLSKDLGSIVGNDGDLIQDYTKDTLDKLKGTKNFKGVPIGNNKGIDVTFSIPEQDPNNKHFSFLDLKPYFAQSDKVKYKKDGGWYLKVPIRNTTRTLRSALSNSEYQKLTHLTFGSTTSVDGLANLKEADDTIDELNYQWKSNNVTRIQMGNSNRGMYMSFRTVSDKSSPSSWILNRNSTTYNNTDEIDRIKIAKQLEDNLAETLTR